MRGARHYPTFTVPTSPVDEGRVCCFWMAAGMQEASAPGTSALTNDVECIVIKTVILTAHGHRITRPRSARRLKSLMHRVSVVTPL